VNNERRLGRCISESQPLSAHSAGIKPINPHVAATTLHNGRLQVLVPWVSGIVAAANGFGEFGVGWCV
jgi:hypothetical protein